MTAEAAMGAVEATGQPVEDVLREVAQHAESEQRRPAVIDTAYQYLVVQRQG